MSGAWDRTRSSLAPLSDAVWTAEVLDSSRAVVVVFWAEWCVPCRTLLSTLETVAGRYRDAFHFGALDVDGHAEVAKRYGIQGLPTLMLFRGRQTLERRVGLMDPSDLEHLLDCHVLTRRPK